MAEVILGLIIVTLLGAIPIIFTAGAASLLRNI
jgi:hypothetical protein